MNDPPVHSGLEEISNVETVGLGSLGYVQVPKDDHENGNEKVNVSSQSSDNIVLTKETKTGTNSNTNVLKETPINVPKTLNEQSCTKSLKGSKSGSKTKKSAVSKQLSTKTIPKFNKNGHCTVCKSDNAIEESIACNVCNILFHAVCRDKRVHNLSSKSICTKTFLDQVRPVIAKYGANSERWGNFMFVCVKCSDIVQGIKTTKTCAQNPTKVVDSAVNCTILTDEVNSLANKTNSPVHMVNFEQNCDLLHDNYKVVNSIDNSSMTDIPLMADVFTMANDGDNDMANVMDDMDSTDYLQNIEGNVLSLPDVSETAVNTCLSSGSNLEANQKSAENDSQPEIEDNKALFAKIGQHIEDLFSAMKENLLIDVDQLISDKLSRPLSSVSMSSFSRSLSCPSTPEIPEELSETNVIVDSVPQSYAESLKTSKNDSVVKEADSIQVCPNDDIIGPYISRVKESFISSGTNSELTPKSPSSIFPTSPSICKESQSEEYVLVVSGEGANLAEVMKAVEKKFVHIPLTFLKLSDNGKKVLIGFPSEELKENGKSALNEYTEVCENRLAVTEAKKMYPKVTVTNVPNYLLSHIMNDKHNLSVPEYRDKLKEYLKLKFLEKDEFISQQVQNDNKMFSIVYVNVGKEYTTLAIKLSPIIRTHLMNNHKQWIYIGNTRCKVTDRFNVKQCFKCQRIGHISTDCTESHPICMYCSASHSTHTCAAQIRRIPQHTDAAIVHALEILHM